MKNKILFTFMLLLFLGVVFFVFNKKGGEDNQLACFNESCFYVELAKTSDERAIGLMHRTELSQDSGMVFVFGSEDRHSFWMKNTLISLDIIWIDKDYNVVFIKKSAEPCKSNPCLMFTPDKKAKYVLELNAGIVEKENIKIGDKITFKLELK